MPCPPDKAVVVKQFDDTPDNFWQDFSNANPTKKDLELKMHFDSKYASCIYNLPSGQNAHNLTDQIKTQMRTCMLQS